MAKMMKKVANGVKTMAARATGLVRDKKGENYVCLLYTSDAAEE